MERLPADKLLKYHPDTMQVVRSLYNMDKPGQMDEAVDSLEAWIQKQEHFMKKDFRREYLERVIIQLKGSVERAKSQIDKMCTLRTIMPKFFAISNPQEDLKEINEYASLALMPNLTKEHRRIFISKLNEGHVHTQRKLFLLEAYSLLLNEYMKLHDYCDGVIIICDLRGIHITELIGAINLTDLRQTTTIIMEGYDTRIKSMHYISTSKTIDILMKLVKQMFSTKISNRIHVHKTVEEIFEFVPQALLPKDYGGDEISFKELNERCLKVFSSEENSMYLKELRDACTDESRRSVPIFNESELGMAGTFRTLNVD